MQAMSIILEDLRFSGLGIKNSCNYLLRDTNKVSKELRYFRFIGTNEFS